MLYPNPNLFYQPTLQPPVIYGNFEWFQIVNQQTRQQISNGLQVEYSSTGYPINELSGNAWNSAVIKNIGGGSMNEGIRTLRMYDISSGYIAGHDNGFYAGFYACLQMFKPYFCSLS